MAYPTKDSFTFDHTAQGTYPGWTPEESKANLNKRSEEMRVALNNLVAALNSTGDDNWLYKQIANAILDQVADASLTDIKLSDAEGQIKARFTTLSDAYDAFVATKAQADGLASLGSDSKLTASQMPLTSVSGSFTDTSTSITAGAEYTKTIPLGLTGVTGSCRIAGKASNIGAFVLFNTVMASSKGIGNYNTSLNPIFVADGAFGAFVDDGTDDIRLQNCYIDGTNLKLIFKNLGASTKTLYVTGCIWEVQA